MLILRSSRLTLWLSILINSMTVLFYRIILYVVFSVRLLLFIENTNKVISEKVRHKQSCTSSEDG